MDIENILKSKFYFWEALTDTEKNTIVDNTFLFDCTIYGDRSNKSICIPHDDNRDCGGSDKWCAGEHFYK